jgi:nucleotide-binding universal stress UspA family protein
MVAPTMREVLLHGSPNEAFDRAVVFARQLAESFGARLHIIYAVEDPLAAGWTAEVSAERLPELHQAMEDEARERLARSISLEDQERLGVQLVIRTGSEARELVLYTSEHPIDLAIVHAPAGDADHAEMAHELIEHGRCAVLVLR